MGNGPGDLAEYQRLIDKYDSFFGGCIWEYTDHSVAIGELKYQKPGFVYGGDFGEFPHDAEFCVDGLVYPDRRPHTGLFEAKAAFTPFNISYENGKITVKSKRRFTNLNDLILVYTVERFGNVILTGNIDLDVAPQSEAVYALELPTAEGLTTLNISVKQKYSTEWAEAGYEVGAVQFILSDEKAEAKSDTDTVEITEDASGYTVVFGECEVRIGKLSGLIESIISDGKDTICEPITPIMWRAPTDNDRKIRITWQNQHLNRLVCHGRNVKIDGNTVTAELILAANGSAPAARIDVKYSFDNGGIRITTHTRIENEITYLPRFGFKFTLPEEFENLSYLGYGPYEAYEDKRLASRISQFNTTVTENFEHYVRPQENSAHYGCKWASISSVTGYSLFFAAEGFSLSASHYEPHYLTNFKHDFELTPQRESTVIIDYRNSGIGSASCGPTLNEKYRISEKEFDFEFSLKPCVIGNKIPEIEYAKLV
jgi:beta-galactosidase